MLDYNFPSFSWASAARSEAGQRKSRHGALAERSVKPVLASAEQFPTRSAWWPTSRIQRLLLDGHRLRRHVGADVGGGPDHEPGGGHLIGLVKEQERWTLLTDIIGDEDHFRRHGLPRSAGTQNGITGIQLDLKIDGISEDIIRATLAQAREGAAADPAGDADHDPRTTSRHFAVGAATDRTQIDPEKIGLLIGPRQHVRRISRDDGDGHRDRGGRNRHHRQHQ